MANFFEELWSSIFTPGASPQLIVATHVSFFMLSCCLGWLIYCTKNGHFVALLGISTLLWVTVTWFISELNHAKLNDNQSLAKKNDGDKTSDNAKHQVSEPDKKLEQNTQGNSSAVKVTKTKSRKA
ncbi:LANO_0H02542g1_1 [Lachancea nothofagi CBS 11611]|uniref:LANO_0H02542g1_1 n=1 Tax=Lachancea nothofagi CBS 11611 TaxID=1266666 RepID=A0A1G4KLD8_9SACH|nr:LANO_0H02542g1_1 [Lachancea nothofagi CBS 11611]